MVINSFEQVPPRPINKRCAFRAPEAILLLGLEEPGRKGYRFCADRFSPVELSGPALIA